MELKETDGTDLQFGFTYVIANDITRVITYVIEYVIRYLITYFITYLITYVITYPLCLNCKFHQTLMP